MKYLLPVLFVACTAAPTESGVALSYTPVRAVCGVTYFGDDPRVTEAKLNEAISSALLSFKETADPALSSEQACWHLKGTTLEVVSECWEFCGEADQVHMKIALTPGQELYDYVFVHELAHVIQFRAHVTMSPVDPGLDYLHFNWNSAGIVKAILKADTRLQAIYLDKGWTK